MKINKSPDGYCQTRISSGCITKTIKIHNIVMLSFIGKKPPLYTINHIDGIKENNSLSNLEYCTRSENMKHAYRLGLVKAPKIRQGFTGDKSINAKKVAQMSKDGKIIKIYLSVITAAKDVGISPGGISCCCLGKKSYITSGGYKWKYI